MLRNFRCNRIVLIQPQNCPRRKTDRRDAAKLSEDLFHQVFDGLAQDNSSSLRRRARVKNRDGDPERLPKRVLQLEG